MTSQSWPKAGEGKIDYHAVSNVVNVEGKIPQDTTPTDRYYLAGAMFLAGVEGSDRTFLEKIHQALLKPRWLLFLGRKSCMPGAFPWIPDGIKDEDLASALRHYPPLTDTVPLFLELEDSTGSPRMDNPLNFGQRQYSPRLVRQFPMQEET